jgi:hypothetical protein
MGRDDWIFETFTTSNVMGIWNLSHGQNFNCLMAKSHPNILYFVQVMVLTIKA